MADNTTINVGTGGDVISTDDLTTLNGGAVSGVKVQRVKVGWGVDGTFTDASASTPIPVSLATAPTTPVTGTFWQATQPVSLATNTPTLAAGAAIVGKVGIDQTTAGTTNAVSLAQLGTTAIATSNGATNTGTLRVSLSSDSTGQAAIATRTTGGATAFTQISAATTNATSIKATAGTVYAIQASNTGASVAFLKLYNLATAPTVGTSVAVMTLIIPAGGGITVPIPPQGINFATGIAMAVTGVATTADTTAVALAQVVTNIQYV